MSEWSCAVVIGRKEFYGVNGRVRSRSVEKKFCSVARCLRAEKFLRSEWSRAVVIERKSFYGVNGRVQSLSSEKSFTE